MEKNQASIPTPPILNKMGLCNILSISSFLLTTVFFFFTTTHAATFNIQNRCSYTVWAAAVPGGGRQLNAGQSWSLNVNAGTTGARIWPRTGCSFDGSGNGINNLDFFDISLVDGFNVPMRFSPTSNGCSRGITCNADVIGQCPAALKTTGGCNNPCTVFKTNEYCCNTGSCSATDYSRYFKGKCPDAYSYPKDDQTSTFTCPGGTNYEVVFCP